VDLALDPISGSLLGSTLACVRDFGRVVVFGMVGGSPGTVTTDLLHSRNRSVIGYSTGGHVRERPDRLYPSGEAVLRLLQSDEIRIMLGARYPLEDATQAHRDLESGASTGKLLLHL
jgi:NADPH2:quinone reductase